MTEDLKNLEKATEALGANDDEYDYETLEKLQEKNAKRGKREGLREDQLKPDLDQVNSEPKQGKSTEDEKDKEEDDDDDDLSDMEETDQ